MINMKIRPWRYVGNLVLLPAVLLDFALNTVTGGSPFETVSGRAGRVKIAFDGHLPKRRYFLRFVDWLTELVDDNHIVEAARMKLGSSGTIDRPEDLEK